MPMLVVGTSVYIYIVFFATCLHFYLSLLCLTFYVVDSVIYHGCICSNMFIMIRLQFLVSVCLSRFPVCIHSFCSVDVRALIFFIQLLQLEVQRNLDHEQTLLTPKGSLREFRLSRRLMLFERFLGIDGELASKG